MKRINMLFNYPQLLYLESQSKKDKIFFRGVRLYFNGGKILSHNSNFIINPSTNFNTRSSYINIFKIFKV